MWICSKCEHENSDNLCKCKICETEKPRVIMQNPDPILQKPKWHQRPWFYIGSLIAAALIIVLLIVIIVDKSKLDSIGAIAASTTNIPMPIPTLVEVTSITDEEITVIASESEMNAGLINISNIKLVQDGVLTVGMEIGFPPFEDYGEDGTTPIGYDVDFTKALGQKLNLTINLVNTSWASIFQGIGVNYDCVISAIMITNERKETMLFSDPYVNNYQDVVVRSDYVGTINSIHDLDGLAIAVQTGTTSDILMSDYISTGFIDCTLSDNEKATTCFIQLENGEVDAIVVDSIVADGYIASNPDKFKKIFQDESNPEQFGVAMMLDNTVLQDAINEAIAQLTAEGFFEQNVASWFGK